MHECRECRMQTNGLGLLKGAENRIYYLTTKDSGLQTKNHRLRTHRLRITDVACFKATDRARIVRTDTDVLMPRTQDA